MPIRTDSLLDNHPITGFTLGFSLTRHNVSGRRAQEHATSGKTARAPTSHSLHSPTAGVGGHPHEAEIMRPWTNYISLTLTCILAGLQENVYVGHRRDSRCLRRDFHYSKQHFVLPAYCCSEAQLRNCKSNAHTLLKPNCMRNGFLEAYAQASPCVTMVHGLSKDLAILKAMRGGTVHVCTCQKMPIRY